jgi:iron complex transport system substrate-binding protein
VREINQITGAIIETACHVHTSLGPGLLESVYESVLAELLTRRGFSVKRQMSVPLEFEGVRLKEAFRVDLFVEDTVVVELKSVETLPPVCIKQLLTYLRLLDAPVGLVLNFGANTMREGIRRVAHRLPSPEPASVQP